MGEYLKFVDVTKCTGCRACMVACKNWNDLPAEIEEFDGSYQSHKKTTANTWNVLTFTEYENSEGSFEWLFRHSACMHCTDAACEKVCPEEAISHTQFGSVIIDTDKCVGCGYCVQNCTFGIVQLTTVKDDDGKERRIAQKCTLCTDRIEEGLRPACATACLTGAITFGEKEQMLQMAKERLTNVQSQFPNANIYNPSGINGTHTIYLLAEQPSVYGLPTNPAVPFSAKLWKDVAQPVGKSLIGVSAMAVVGAFVANSLFNKNHEDTTGGEDDEQK